MTTLVVRFDKVDGFDELAGIDPGDDIPIVDQAGRVIGYAIVDGDSLVWCRTDGATADAVHVGCGPVSIGGSVQGE